MLLTDAAAAAASASCLAAICAKQPRQVEPLLAAANRLLDRLRRLRQQALFGEATGPRLDISSFYTELYHSQVGLTYLECVSCPAWRMLKTRGPESRNNRFNRVPFSLLSSHRARCVCVLLTTIASCRTGAVLRPVCDADRGCCQCAGAPGIWQRDATHGLGARIRGRTRAPAAQAWG